jgi:uncharacterized DUF497 family protein
VRIHRVIWLRQFVNKLESKHGVSTDEVEETLYGKMKVRRIAKGDVHGEDLYLALGQTTARLFVLKDGRDALPISARDMDAKERRSYGRK